MTMQRTEIPILYTEKKDCCGCCACMSICPVKAIYIEEDIEGFGYPIIDEEKCMRCYKCINVCPFKEKRGR